MHFYTRTWGALLEYQWHPVPNLTLTPGVKYMRVQRVIEAADQPDDGFAAAVL